jgi:hypothetical protein
VELLYKGYNQDEIALLDPIAQALLHFRPGGKNSEYESIYNEQIDQIEKLQAELQESLEVAE